MNPELVKKPRIGRKTSFALRAGMIGGLVVGGTAYWAHENPADAVKVSRSIVGQKWTVKGEKLGLYLDDKIEQLKFDILGGETSPYKDGVDPALVVLPTNYSSSVELEYNTPVTIQAEPELQKRPAPMVIPEINLLQDPVVGEGVWTTQGVPSNPEDPVMVRTFLHADTARDGAWVDMMLFDKRRIKLNIVGGTVQPGIERGIKGPGVILGEDKENLIAAWNGGFQGEHASWGMYANEREYKPLRNGYASIVVMKDGGIKMGTWGQGELAQRTDEMSAIRQNAVLLLDNCELTPDALNRGEDPNVWGRYLADSPVFITSRSAVGLTREGNLLVAVANRISAKNLARAMKAAGACVAMQLDINESWVAAGIFFKDESGKITAQKLSPNTTPNPNKYIDNVPEEKDFMYVVIDETNHK